MNSWIILFLAVVLVLCIPGVAKAVGEQANRVLFSYQVKTGLVLQAFANSAISDIIATTIQSRTGEVADNVTSNNALLTRLKQRGNVRTFSGGNTIMQE